MKLFILSALVCFSFSASADKSFLGQKGPDTSTAQDPCQAATMTGCKDCQIRHCVGINHSLGNAKRDRSFGARAKNQGRGSATKE